MSPPMHPAITPIATRRLRLEPLRVEHAAALYEGLREPDLYRFTDDAPPPSLEWLEARYARLERRTSPDGLSRWLNWAIWAPEQGRHVGYVQATVDPPGDEAGIAYVLLSPYRGRGYAREAVAAMLAALAEDGVARFSATTDAANARSIALLQALGFRPAPPGIAGHGDIRWIGSAENESRLPPEDNTLERGTAR